MTAFRSSSAASEPSNICASFRLAKFFANLPANGLQKEHETHFLHCNYHFESVGLQALTLEHWNGASGLQAA